MMMLIVVCFLHAVAKDNENVNYLRLLRYARNDGFYFVIARRYDVAICL